MVKILLYFVSPTKDILPYQLSNTETYLTGTVMNLNYTTLCLFLSNLPVFIISSPQQIPKKDKSKKVQAQTHHNQIFEN